MQRNLAGVHPHDTQRTLPFLLRFSELLRSWNKLSCAGIFHARWVALRAREHGGGYRCMSKRFGQAGAGGGCRTEQGPGKPSLSQCLSRFFTTALSRKRSRTHTEREGVGWMLACFCIYVLVCEPARERFFFSSYVSWRDGETLPPPPAMHRLVWEQPAQTYLCMRAPAHTRMHTRACSRTRAAVRLHRHIPADRPPVLGDTCTQRKCQSELTHYLALNNSHYPSQTSLPSAKERFVSQLQGLGQALGLRLPSLPGRYQSGH